MKGNPPTPGGSLTSTPTGSSILQCSTPSAFFFARRGATTIATSAEFDHRERPWREGSLVTPETWGVGGWHVCLRPGRPRLAVVADAGFSVGLQAVQKDRLLRSLSPKKMRVRRQGARSPISAECAR